MTNIKDIKPKPPTATKRKVFRVAPYTIYHATDGNYWIVHDDGGEGIHLTRVEMGGMLDRFYNAK